MTALPRIMTGVESFGPGSARAATREEAWSHVRGVARGSGRGENFSVLSALVPVELRDDFAAVYAFCRWADDLGDETGVGEAARGRALELLSWWRGHLEEMYAGRATHPVFVALCETVERHGLPKGLFADLIGAFEQDQRVTRYATWGELLGYCQRSADPVGRLVLHLGGYRDEPANAERYRLSDLTCTALQLVNFWQDVRRDLVERDRVYFPSAETEIDAETLRAWLDRGDDPACRVRFILAMRPLVEKTAAMFDEAAALPGMLDRRIAPVVWLFGRGGRAVVRGVERVGCATLWGRPVVGRVTKAGLVARAFVGARLGLFGGGR
jgi:squalene synthase HpnC